MVKMKVTVTKKNYADSVMCGITTKETSQNCAIALAIRDLLPQAAVGPDQIWPSEHLKDVIKLPFEARMLIMSFDSLCDPETCQQRRDLPETTFEIEIPDSVIDEIPLPNLANIMDGHPNLALVMAED